MCVSLCDSLLVLSIKHLFTIAFTTAQGKAIQRIKINPFRSYLLLNDTLFVFSKEYVLRQSYQIRGLSKALRSVKPGKRCISATVVFYYSLFHSKITSTSHIISVLKHIVHNYRNSGNNRFFSTHYLFIFYYYSKCFNF